MSIIMYKQRFKPPTKKSTPKLDYLHIGYIATRPRCMKNGDGIHGLFGYLSPTEPCNEMPWQDTARYIRKLSEKNINIYRSIISFHRPDADEIGLKTQKDWQIYAELHIKTLAEKNGIDMSNLGWCGAYHNEGDHPHLHIAFWDKSQKVAVNYKSPKIANSIRIELIKNTFEDKIKKLYEQKDRAKENIGSNYNEDVANFDEYMKSMRAKNFKAVRSEFDTYSDAKKININHFFNNDEQLADTASKLFLIRDSIPKGGRIAYKLLPPEVKEMVDSLTDSIIKDNSYLRNAVKQYVDIQCDLKMLYHSDPSVLAEYRAKCEAEARKIVSNRILKSVRAIISKEFEVRNGDFTNAQKKYFAIECMREILEFFAQGIVARNSMINDKRLNGELSERAIKEWYSQSF